MSLCYRKRKSDVVTVDETNRSVIPRKVVGAGPRRRKTTNGSILRYPGGKSRAVHVLDGFIGTNVKEICAPFVGGASFELHCAQTRGIPVYASDVFEPLINFWQCLKEDVVCLIAQVLLVHPVSREVFYELRKRVVAPITITTTTTEPEEKEARMRRAAAFFAVNRCSFSGTTMSGGYSKDSAENRFTKSAIERLQWVDLSNIHFACGDFKDAISRHPDATLFLDPPYMMETRKQNNLYGKNGRLHSAFNHEELHRTLSICPQEWVLCYNNGDNIRTLYKDYDIRDLSWSYGMGRDKTSREIVILRRRHKIEGEERDCIVVA